jgi:serine/threonine protein kinase
MREYVGEQLGHYRVLRLLGRGGFAHVYLGEHLYLNSLAALKVLHTQFSEEEAAAFLREAQTLMHLSHPHIIRVLDFAVENGTPFLVMEYAPHGTLRQRHPKGTRLPPNTIVPYVRQVASALQYAHDRQFVHRDVKPENMLLGERFEVLLADFGLTMLTPDTNSERTQAMNESLTGTVPYLAPEQLQGHPRLASDQYTLGIVVYEWLCGTHPFSGSPLEIFMQHQATPSPPLRAYVPDLSADIEAVVLRALEKEPGRRFAPIADFATAFQQACGEVASAPAVPVLASAADPTTPKERARALALPNLKQLPTSEALAQIAAVALFLERAQAIQSDFALTQANARTIAEICVVLTGCRWLLSWQRRASSYFLPRRCSNAFRSGWRC